MYVSHQVHVRIRRMSSAYLTFGLIRTSICRAYNEQARSHVRVSPLSSPHRAVRNCIVLVRTRSTRHTLIGPNSEVVKFRDSTRRPPVARYSLCSLEPARRIGYIIIFFFFFFLFFPQRCAQRLSSRCSAPALERDPGNHIYYPAV